MSRDRQRFTESEQQALEALKQQKHLSRSELVDRLDVNSPDEVSDIMRSLRYKGEVFFSFEDGFQLKDSK